MEQKVDITNTSPKIAALLLIFIAMNTCVSMVHQELAYQKQKEQLEQGKVPDGISPELMAQAQQGANMQAVGRLQQAMRAA